jgi:hypothetical protein
LDKIELIIVDCYNASKIVPCAKSGLKWHKNNPLITFTKVQS